MRICSASTVALIDTAAHQLAGAAGLIERAMQRYFSADTRHGANRYAPLAPVVRLAGAMADEIFPAWSGAGADREAHQIIRFFASMPKAIGHGHRHWAFDPETSEHAQPFILLDADGRPMLSRDHQVFRSQHAKLPLSADIAAGFYLHHSPHKDLHGFFDDRTLVADLYLRLLDPHHNVWLREHARVNRWLAAPSDAPLIVIVQLQRPIGHIMQRDHTLGARLAATECTDCVAILKKCRSTGMRPDFYLATAYPLPPRAETPVVL